MKSVFQLDLSGLSQELLLMVSILRLGGNPSGKLDPGLHDREPDWPHFLELARHHRVYPVVHTELAKLDQAPIPRWVREALLHDYQSNVFHMLPLSAEMVRLCSLFAEQGIRVLLLKGPVLASELYGDLSLRTSGDLDLLVPIHDLVQAERLLCGLGYVKDDYIQTILGDWKWRHHHIAFFHPLKQVKLELHWRLSPGPGKEPGFQELWDRKRKSAQSNLPVYLLGREDLFLFLIAHGARHGWSRLRWLVDIDRMARLGLEPVLLRKLVKARRLRHVGGQALWLAAGLLHTPLDEELKRLTIGGRPKRLAQAALFYQKQMVNLHTFPIPRDVARFHKLHLFDLMPLRQKLLFLLSFLHPYPEDAATLPLPKGLHGLYFPLRPFLWLWRKSKRAGTAVNKEGAG